MIPTNLSYIVEQQNLLGQNGGINMKKYEVIVKINTTAEDEIEAKNKAWKFLCFANMLDIYFDIKEME